MDSVSFLFELLSLGLCFITVPYFTFNKCATGKFSCHLTVSLVAEEWIELVLSLMIMY